MSAPISVIVVSRHRREALQRCIQSLRQQDHEDFEVIIVADPDAASHISMFNTDLKILAFDQANISAARNIGLAVAAADIVAFIDDDAVAEPTWLSRISAPFADSTVVASTGFVRARNGISYQWKASEVDAFGQDHPFEVSTPAIFSGHSKRSVKTQGTNCAFRRNTLCEIGGFDSAFRFYLDEADVNLRLAEKGRTAVIPDAQVHHGYEASERRSAERVPLSLFEIAASTATFLRRHVESPDFALALAALSKRESDRIERHRRAGRLTATAELDLLLSLQDGWTAGLEANLAPLVPLKVQKMPLLRFSSFGPKPGRHIAGRIWQRRKLTEIACNSAQTHVTTMFCFSPTARPHRLRFDSAGFWIQTGGIFGRSERTDRPFRLTTFGRRLNKEIQRLAKYRSIL